MKKSISYWSIGGMGGETPIEEAMKLARQAGYEAIELTFGDCELRPGVGDSRCKDIARAAADMGLEISSLASGGGWGSPITSQDAQVRARAEEENLAYVKTASMLGVDAVLLVPGFVGCVWEEGSEVVPYDIAWDNALAAVTKLAKVGEDEGVTVCVENVWNRFLLSPLEMRRFVEEVGSPGCGVYFDPANVMAVGYPEHWIRILGGLIKRVHVKNCAMDRCGYTLAGFGEDLLDGDVDWKAVIAQLADAGYDGYLTCEIIPFKRLFEGDGGLHLPDYEICEKWSKQLDQMLGRA